MKSVRKGKTVCDFTCDEPNRKYRKYNIKELGQNFIAAVLLKSRFGTSDIVDPMGFYGNINMFAELPKAENICDYTRYKDPLWCLENDTNEKDTKTKSNIKITL